MWPFAFCTCKHVFVASQIRPFYKAKWSKYPDHKSELVRHLNIDSSEKFDTQTWTPKQRCETPIKKIGKIL